MPSSRFALSRFGSFLLIAAVVAAGAAAYGYTAGWFSSDRLTPARFVAALAPPGGPALGHRRDHAKGICFTGAFEANGAGASLSKASVFVKGRYPVVGRFSLGTPDLNEAAATVRVRGIGLQITTPDGQEWRTGMINPPVFPVSTPQAFYALLVALARKNDPDAMKNFAAAHPEIGAFGAWAHSAPFTESYAEERYNSIDSFIFTDGSGAEHVVRWSLDPAAQPVGLTADDLGKRAPNFLEDEIAQRVASAPQRWTLTVALAEPGDPTADPSKAWPESRRTVAVGTLVAERIMPEADGPCRDVNYDPTVLPSGIRTSDDPFPAARSEIYAVSVSRRTQEAADYPRLATPPQK
jgi:catalase